MAAIMIVALAIAGAIALPAVIAALGFTTAGVAAGSVAAGIQAGIGNVAAGSLFAFMQSIGTAPILTAGVGSLFGAVALL